MIEFLQKNSWLTSSIAIVISAVSAYFVIRDRLKAWKERDLLINLKKDKAILSPLLSLDVKDYHDEIIKEHPTGGKHTTRSPHYSRLYYLLKGIDSSKVSNEIIAEKLKAIQAKKVDDLFGVKNVPNGRNFSVQFSEDLQELIVLTRSYLAQVI